MKLDEFVAKSLQDIMNGVKTAQDAKATHMSIGTGGRNKMLNVASGVMQDNNGALYTTIEFDVAVTVTKEGGGSLAVSVLELLKVEGRGGGDHQTVSRVKFSVPACFK